MQPSNQNVIYVHKTRTSKNDKKAIGPNKQTEEKKNKCGDVDRADAGMREEEEQQRQQSLRPQITKKAKTTRGKERINEATVDQLVFSINQTKTDLFVLSRTLRTEMKEIKSNCKS